MTSSQHVHVIIVPHTGFDVGHIFCSTSFVLLIGFSNESPSHTDSKSRGAPPKNSKYLVPAQNCAQPEAPRHVSTALPGVLSTSRALVGGLVH